MTANASTKTEPRWRAWLRRVTRPRPYWQRRLDDNLEPPGALDDAIGQVAGSVARILALMVVGLAVLLPASVIVRLIFFSPAFLSDGLAGAIGAGLADVCASTGQCDLRYLLAGAALAVPTLTLIGLMLANAFYWRTADEDEQEVTETELMDALDLLDQRIVQLRADLVLSGVVKVREEEKPEEPLDSEGLFR